MKRRLSTAASLLSLMLCAAMAALWVRSYWRDSSLDFCSRSHRLSLRIVRGHVAFEVFTPEEPFEMDERGFFNTSFADSGGGSDLEWMISRQFERP